MENTRENAAEFWRKCREATFVAVPATSLGIMMAYADRVTASKVQRINELEKENAERLQRIVELEDELYQLKEIADMQQSYLRDRIVEIRVELESANKRIAELEEQTKFCECEFVMVMRDTNTGHPHCGTCGKLILR